MCYHEHSSVTQRKTESASNSSGVVLVAQSFPTLCDTVNCSNSGSSVHEISQARILEWVDIFFFRGVCISLPLITTLKSHRLQHSSRSLHFSDPVSSLKLV